MNTTTILLSVIEIVLALVLPNPQSSCTCGMKKEEKNNLFSGIIGGNHTDVNEYPWMAAIMLSDRFHCGGSVINSKWIITAAHCVAGLEKHFVKVKLGEHNLMSDTDTKLIKQFEVDEIVVYGGAYRRHDDLALLKVKGIIDISIYTPICLPKPGLDIVGKEITLAGWGCTTPNCTRPAAVLQELVLPVVSNEICQAQPYVKDVKDLNVFCFGGEEGKNACHGDSGSGLMYNDNGKYTIVGTVHGPTNSDVCALGENYTSAPEISKYLGWIEQVARGGESCKN